MTVVVASGYFDPLHVGHIEYLELAKKLGDRLIVIINNDVQAKLKKGKSFMKQDDRAKIISSLACVDEIFISIDQDKTQCETLKFLKPDIFTNGGDRNNDEIPEANICKKLKIQIIDGLGDKIRSSSNFTGIKKNT